MKSFQIVNVITAACEHISCVSHNDGEQQTTFIMRGYTRSSTPPLTISNSNNNNDDIDERIIIIIIINITIITIIIINFIIGATYYHRFLHNVIFSSVDVFIPEDTSVCSDAANLDLSILRIQTTYIHNTYICILRKLHVLSLNEHHYIYNIYVCIIHTI